MVTEPQSGWRLRSELHDGSARATRDHGSRGNSLVREAVVAERVRRGPSPPSGARRESFNGRLRDEFLNGWQFDNLLEAQVLIEDWRTDYNTHRPHSAHGDLTPNEFANAWTTRNQPALA